MTLLLLFSGRYVPPDPSPERTGTPAARNRSGAPTLNTRTAVVPERVRIGES